MDWWWARSLPSSRLGASRLWAGVLAPILAARSVGLSNPASHLVGGEPARIHDLFGKLLVEVRSNELVKRVNKLSVLAPAQLGPLFWQVVLLHNIGKQDSICPISKTQQVNLFT